MTRGLFQVHGGHKEQIFLYAAVLFDVQHKTYTLRRRCANNVHMSMSSVNIHHVIKCDRNIAAFQSLTVFDIIGVFAQCPQKQRLDFNSVYKAVRVIIIFRQHPSPPIRGAVKKF